MPLHNKTENISFNKHNEVSKHILGGSQMQGGLNSMQPADIVMVPPDSLRKLDVLVESPSLTERDSPEAEKRGAVSDIDNSQQQIIVP